MLNSETKQEIMNLWFPQGHLSIQQAFFIAETVSKIRPKHCIEIGFASGRSAVSVLAACNPKILISVEITFENISGSEEHSKKIMNAFPNFDLIIGDSRDVITPEFCKKYYPHGIDFAFVDGGHSYECCKSDLEKTFCNLNSGGIIMVDDYYSGPPKGCKIVEVESAVKDFIENKDVKIQSWHSEGKGMAIISKQ